MIARSEFKGCRNAEFNIFSPYYSFIIVSNASSFFGQNALTRSTNYTTLSNKCHINSRETIVSVSKTARSTACISVLWTHLAHELYFKNRLPNHYRWMNFECTIILLHFLLRNAQGCPKISNNGAIHSQKLEPHYAQSVSVGDTYSSFRQRKLSYHIWVPFPCSSLKAALWYSTFYIHISTITTLAWQSCTC